MTQRLDRKGGKSLVGNHRDDVMVANELNKSYGRFGTSDFNTEWNLIRQ